MLLSNFMLAVNFLHAVFSARHAKVVENVRSGMSPGEILRELLRMGLNLKGALYFILLRGRYEAPGKRVAYYFDSIVFVDDRSLAIPRLDDLQDLDVSSTVETLSYLRNITTKSVSGG